jgi:hypothetical protein
MEVGLVRQYLVVANQTLGGDHLIQAIRERMMHEPSKFWVLVPATEPAHYAEVGYGMGYASGAGVNPYGMLAGVEPATMSNSGESAARQRLDIELERLHQAGAQADGEVGDPDPIKAITETLKHRQFDEIILSTLPHTRSRWSRQDLPSKVKSKFGLPVTHIISA